MGCRRKSTEYNRKSAARGKTWQQKDLGAMERLLERMLGLLEADGSGRWSQKQGE